MTDRILANVGELFDDLARLRGPDWRAGLTVVAVSKTVGPDEVRAAAEAGLAHFGENRVQELVRKVSALEGARGLHWHLIGHLQTNKARTAVGHAEIIHSVDSVKLALEVDRHARGRPGPPYPVLLEVNVSGEGSKSGFAPWALDSALDELARRDEIEPLAIEVVGLMTMAPLTGEETVLRSTFRGLAALRDRLRQRGARWLKPEHLSMGMSNDYRIAVEEGATMIRIGTRIFAPGDRS